MKRWLAVAVCAGVVAGCDSGPKTASKRVELRQVSGALVQLVPSEGQHPYCLAYTISEKGVVRQLTLMRDNLSVDCPAGQPIRNRTFRIPLEEGKVKIYVVFSDQRLNAGSIAEQISNLAPRGRISGMDFRAPGVVQLETLEFTPGEGAPVETGAVVTPDGGAAPADAGTPPAVDAGAAPADAGR